MKNFQYLAGLLAIIVSSFIVYYVIVRIAALEDGVLQPIVVKLGVASDSQTEFRFKGPHDAELFNLVLGFTKEGTEPEDFEGAITLYSEGKEIYKTSIPPTTLKRCGFPDKHGFRGYVLNWTNNARFPELIAGKSYRIKITTTHTNDEPVSVWLSYLQRWKTAEGLKDPGRN